ncbi:ABC transporter permease, partial [Pseudomonadota bacterium]
MPKLAISTDPETLPAAGQVLEPSPWAQMRQRAFGHLGLLLGGGTLLLMLLMAFFAPVLAPYDPLSQDLTNRFVPPIWHAQGTWEHIFGTDAFGRDYLSRMIYGSQVSLVIGLAAMLISGVIGTVLGICAGYFGGRVDMVITFLITIRLAMPAMLVALAVVALVGG